MCVSCANILLNKFDPLKMLPSKHGGVAYMQLSCIDGTVEIVVHNPKIFLHVILVRLNVF